MKTYGPERNDLRSFVVTQVVAGQRFVVPDAGKMLVGRPFDEFKDALRLPFDRIAMMREIPLPEVGKTRQLIVAASDEVVTGSRSDVDFWVADCLEMPLRGASVWIPSRPIGIDVRNGPGLQIVELSGMEELERRLTGYARSFRDDDPEGDGYGALCGLSDLLVMLSLSNVGRRRIDAPLALNRKREATGKLPIYDYHVLTVDGRDTFDTFDEVGGGQHDRRIRSHFRRGHIRRIGDGRRVWVRHAYVHGRADGFVDKDYRVAA